MAELPATTPEIATAPPADSIPVKGTAVQTSNGEPDIEGAPPAALKTASPSSAQQSSSKASADPFHTDVYPNNVYSEELLYDEAGNLIGKTVTIPTEFGPDAIWIDGRAYYDVPGLGLVEWSGPGQRTEAYNMYENGNKVGIMGGEDEVPANTGPVTQAQELPEPTGEVIDQTINEIP